MRGVIVTSRSATSGIDFVSRFFAPGVGVDEDPGSPGPLVTIAPWHRIGPRGYPKTR